MNNDYKTIVKEFGDLAPGDKLIGSDGKPVVITDVYEKHIPQSMYEIEMEDGEIVQASGNHLWYCETDIDESQKEEYLRLAKAFFENNKIPEKLEEDELFPINDIVKIFGNEIDTMLFIEKVCKSLGYSSYSPHLYYVDEVDDENLARQEIILNYSYNDLIDFLHNMKKYIFEGKGYFYFGEVRTTTEIAKLMEKGVKVNIPHKSELLGE